MFLNFSLHFTARFKSGCIRERAGAIEAETGSRFITAFGSLLAALQHLGVKRIGLATRYAEDITLKGKAHLEAHGLAVVQYGLLEGAERL
ncbi:hypothetical protein PCAR4_830039 [Paraburkholderia caribensis]|nr:hypothetical protein PCAR4_830039 [Paraburkholderia caribensis]